MQLTEEMSLSELSQGFALDEEDSDDDGDDFEDE